MRFTHRVFTLLSLIVLLFTGAAWTQTGNPAIRVEVPFQFEVGNQVLPAGVYFIDRASPYILVIHDARRKVVATLVPTPAQTNTPSAAPKVQFYVDGGHNVLAKIWTANSRYGYELAPQKTEAAFAKAHSGALTASSGR